MPVQLSLAVELPETAVSTLEVTVKDAICDCERIFSPSHVPLKLEVRLKKKDFFFIESNLLEQSSGCIPLPSVSPARIVTFK